MHLTLESLTIGPFKYIIDDTISLFYKNAFTGLDKHNFLAHNCEHFLTHHF